MNNENRKHKGNFKRLKIGSYSIAVTLVVVVIAVVINLIVSALPTTMTHINTDTVDLYSTGEETASIVDSLTHDVTFYLIAERGGENTVVKELLSRYDGMSGKIHVKTVDPAENPTFTSKYTTDQLSSNSVIAESDLRSCVIPYGKIFTTEYSEEDYINMYYGQQAQGTTYFNGEMVFTSALDYVTREELPTVYTLEGHGETVLDSTYTEYIENENLATAELNLLGADAVPDDCRALLIANPTSDISEDEASKITSYMENGGDVVLVTDFQTFSGDNMPNISKIAMSAGLEGIDGIVIEGDQNKYFQQPYILIPEIVSSSDSITSLLGSSNINTLFWGAHGIMAADGTSAEVTPIVRTSSDAEVKAVTSDGEIVDREDSDGKAQTMVGAMSEIETPDGSFGESSRFIWYSSASLIDVQTASYVGEGNIRLFVASLNYLCGSTASVSILGKTQSIEPLTMSSAASGMWTGIMLVALPLAVAIAGVFVWLRRRRK